MTALCLAGRADDVRRGTEDEAPTAHLLRLHAARLSGRFAVTPHAAREGAIERLLERRTENEALHLQALLEPWRAVGARLVRCDRATADTSVR